MTPPSRRFVSIQTAFIQATNEPFPNADTHLHYTFRPDRIMKSLLALTLTVSFGSTVLWAAPAPAKLKVSDNQRFLVTGDGQPFFWLGDTAWELFHRLNREEANQYLRDRAQKGFTV